MLPVAVLMLVLIQRASAESPIQQLDDFFKNKREEIFEKGRSIIGKGLLSKLEKKQYIQYKPKKYTMNMEDSVETRWGPLCDEYTANYTAIYDYIHGVLESTGAASTVYALAMLWYNRHVEDPYKSEIEYFANCTQVPLKGVVIINLFEVLEIMGCTSIVCANKKNELIFGKNLDLWLLDIQDELRSVMITVEYWSGHNLLFTGDSFFGYSGVLSGVTPNGYSVSVNARYTGVSIFDCLTVLANNGNIPYSFLMRDTLSNYDTYSSAVQEFKTTEIGTPCYFIVGGREYPDAVVITRNFTDSIDAFELETSYLDWYILQTNDDWWGEPTDERRNVGITNMELMGQKHAKPNNLLFDVLSQFETINFGTVAQTLMMTKSRGSYGNSGKKMHNIWIVQYENDQVQTARVDVTNGDDFANDFERWWNKYFGVGMAIFVASLFFNIVMCVYWSAGYTCSKGNTHQSIKVLMSDETESSERDDQQMVDNSVIL